MLASFGDEYQISDAVETLSGYFLSLPKQQQKRELRRLKSVDSKLYSLVLEALAECRQQAKKR